MVGEIFLSYRRDDSAGYAGRLRDHLCAHFGTEAVFRDVDSIRLGADFVAHVEDAVRRSSAVVAVIGRDWLSVVDDAGRRRLDRPDDVVRRELEVALEHAVPVVPVLVEGARMPAPDDLPASIQPLSRRNALEIDDARWDHDVRRLVEHLETATGRVAAGRGSHPTAAPAGERRHPGSTRRAVALVAGVGAAAALLAVRSDADRPSTPSATVAGVTVTSGPEETAPVSRALARKAGAGSFVFDLERATYQPGTAGAQGKVTIDAVVENLAMRTLSPRGVMFLTSGGDNYPLTGGAFPEIPAESKGRATLEFAVDRFSFDDATLLVGEGNTNRTVVPLSGDDGFKAHLPRPLALAGTVRAGTFTLNLTRGLVTVGPIGVLADGRSVPKGRLMLTVFYDFTAAPGGSSSFPNRELSLRLPDQTAVTVGDFADPHVTPGNSVKGLFASFLVPDPADGDYVLRFANGESRGELVFRVR